MIYFIQDSRTRCIKIGFSKGEATRRLRNLQTSSPGRLRLLFQITGGKREEAAIHRELRRFRSNGEWFWPTPEVLAALVRLVFFAGTVFGAECEEAHIEDYATAHDLDGCASDPEPDDLCSGKWLALSMLPNPWRSSLEESGHG